MNKNKTDNLAWLCEDCDIRFEISVTIKETPLCPVCRKPLSILREITVSDLAEGSEFIDLKCKNEKYTSKRKLRRHIRTGVRRDADSRLVDIKRVIDADIDQYEEKVIDLETGKIIRDCKEPLITHRGRGSERKKNK